MWWRANHHKHKGLETGREQHKQAKPSSTQTWLLPGVSAEDSPWSGCQRSLLEVLSVNNLADWVGLLPVGIQDSLHYECLGNGIKLTAGCFKVVNKNMWDLWDIKGKDQRQEQNAEGDLQRKSVEIYRDQWIKKASCMWTGCWSVCLFGHASSLFTTVF